MSPWGSTCRRKRRINSSADSVSTRWTLAPGPQRPGRDENRPVTFVDSSVWIDYFNGRRTPQTEKLD